MKSCSNVKIRRARPLLGTIVDVQCSASDRNTVTCGIDAAFAAVEKVHQLMSFHHPESDVSRINRDAFRKPVEVHPWTWCVLKCAQQIAYESDGVFDITVAPLLVKWNLLPRNDWQVDPDATWRDIVLEKHCTVRFRRRLIVDLGGIAKGFAVDRAAESLRLAGVSSGIVNAGGDLRVFGSTLRNIHLRKPAEPARAAGIVKLRNRAMATSALYFSRRNWRGVKVSSLLDGRTRRALTDFISVTVAAPECMVADALSKIVFALREKVRPLLIRHRADALLLERDGCASSIFSSHAA